MISLSDTLNKFIIKWDGKEDYLSIGDGLQYFGSLDCSFYLQIWLVVSF